MESGETRKEKPVGSVGHVRMLGLGLGLASSLMLLSIHPRFTEYGFSHRNLEYSGYYGTVD